MITDLTDIENAIRAAAAGFSAESEDGAESGETAVKNISKYEILSYDEEISITLPDVSDETPADTSEGPSEEIAEEPSGEIYADETIVAELGNLTEDRLDLSVSFRYGTASLSETARQTLETFDISTDFHIELSDGMSYGFNTEGAGGSDGARWKVYASEDEIEKDLDMDIISSKEVLRIAYLRAETECRIFMHSASALISRKIH